MGISHSLSYFFAFFVWLDLQTDQLFLAKQLHIFFRLGDKRLQCKIIIFVTFFEKLSRSTMITETFVTKQRVIHLAEI